MCIHWPLLPVSFWQQQAHKHTKWSPFLHWLLCPCADTHKTHTLFALTHFHTRWCACPHVRMDTHTKARSQTLPAGMLIGSQCVPCHPGLALFAVKGRGNRCSRLKPGIMGAFGGWAQGRKSHHLPTLDSPFIDILSDSEVPNVQPVGITGQHWEELFNTARQREGKK